MHKTLVYSLNGKLHYVRSSQYGTQLAPLPISEDNRKWIANLLTNDVIDYTTDMLKRKYGANNIKFAYIDEAVEKQEIGNTLPDNEIAELQKAIRKSTRYPS
jgi:hypothetical protein